MQGKINDPGKAYELVRVLRQLTQELSGYQGTISVWLDRGECISIANYTQDKSVATVHLASYNSLLRLDLKNESYLSSIKNALIPQKGSFIEGEYVGGVSLDCQTINSFVERVLQTLKEQGKQQKREEEQNRRVSTQAAIGDILVQITPEEALLLLAELKKVQDYNNHCWTAVAENHGEDVSFYKSQFSMRTAKLKKTGVLGKIVADMIYSSCSNKQNTENAIESSRQAVIRQLPRLKKELMNRFAEYQAKRNRAYDILGSSFISLVIFFALTGLANMILSLYATFKRQFILVDPRNDGVYALTFCAVIAFVAIISSIAYAFYRYKTNEASHKLDEIDELIEKNKTPEQMLEEARVNLELFGRMAELLATSTSEILEKNPELSAMQSSQGPHQEQAKSGDQSAQSADSYKGVCPTLHDGYQAAPSTTLRTKAAQLYPSLLPTAPGQSIAKS